MPCGKIFLILMTTRLDRTTHIFSLPSPKFSFPALRVPSDSGMSRYVREHPLPAEDAADERTDYVPLRLGGRPSMALFAIRLGHPGSCFGIVNDGCDPQLEVVRPFRNVLRERRGVVSFNQGPAIGGTRSMPAPDQFQTRRYRGTGAQKAFRGRLVTARRNLPRDHFMLWPSYAFVAVIRRTAHGYKYLMCTIAL